jgi:hypothetical protein
MSFIKGFVGPWPHRGTGTIAFCGARDNRIQSNFWKFCLIKTGFTLREPVFLVKVFRLFTLERITFGSFALLELVSH